MTGSPENYKGQYGSLKFEPYKFKEFPKAVYVGGVLVGTANNLLEEKELYASKGIERGDIDPMTSLRDENAELKAKLAQFESGQPAIGRTAGSRTNTVSMLPAGPGDGVIGDNVIPEHQETSPRGANPTYNPPPGGDPAAVQHPVPMPGRTPSLNNLSAQAVGTGADGQQKSVSTGVKPNPLLQGKASPDATNMTSGVAGQILGKPGAQGTAPRVDAPIRDEH